MKQILLVLAFLISTLTFAQETESNTSFYLATGLSITNSENFEDSSYISTEVGVMIDNLAFGAVVGRNNLTNAFGNNESLNNYWYESKIAVYESLGSVDGYALLGIGSYVENGNIFLEYGVGISKEFNNFGLFVQVSNWDGVTYVTPGISLSL